MTELKDLKVGDEVTLTIKGNVTEIAEDGAYIDYGDYDSLWVLTHEEVDSGRVALERAPRPMPTEPGVYVPGNNATIAHYSYLYRLGEDEDWSLISDGEEEEITESAARKAHENLGGLVRLVPEQ